MTQRCFLFPGQGAQFVGMGKDLCEAFPAAKAVFDRANERLGFDLAKSCFEGPDDDLVRTDIQQPAILTHSIAAFEALRAAKGDDAVTAVAYCGLSLGEYSALVAAGALTIEDGVYLVRKRGEFMQEASDAYPSTMAAVMKLTLDQVAPICEQAASETGEHCLPANLLGAKNMTISGGVKAVERAVELVKEQRGRGLVLGVAGAFHSPYMQPAEDKLRAEIERTTFSEPRVPVICNVDATAHTDVATLRANLLKQLTNPVRWAESMTVAAGMAVTEYVEPGPGTALTGNLKRTAPEGTTLTNIQFAKDLA
jgi:[acyl-carrier-protein] S-malonyltransferase